MLKSALLVMIIMQYNYHAVTEFDKTRLPCTFSFMTLRDLNSMKKYTISFKFWPVILQCYGSIVRKFQVNSMLANLVMYLHG